MPVSQCPNGKWKIGHGRCIYPDKATAERAYKGYMVRKHTPESYWKESKGQALVICSKCNHMFSIMLERAEKEIPFVCRSCSQH